MKHNNMAVKRILDVVLTVLLLCLMSYQATGEVLHEWGGIAMTVLVIVHHVLNRRWYSAAFKGGYSAYRILMTVVNVLLLLAFAITALSGMSMSGHAVPFLYGMVNVSLARQMHLSVSFWAFVLMGLHLGLHIPVMAAKLKLSGKIRIVLSAVFCCIAGAGLFLFIKNGIPEYLFFRTPFAFFDYDKPGALVFLENILMLLFWAFIGTAGAVLCRRARKTNEINF